MSNYWPFGQQCVWSGHFGTFWDYSEDFLTSMSHLRPISPIIGSLKKTRYGWTHGLTDGKNLFLSLAVSLSVIVWVVCGELNWGEFVASEPFCSRLSAPACCCALLFIGRRRIFLNRKPFSRVCVLARCRTQLFIGRRRIFLDRSSFRFGGLFYNVNPQKTMKCH